MHLQALKHQLVSMRAAIDAALILLGEEEEQPQGCQHPQESRLDMSTMGHIRWQCGLCGYTHEEEVG